ncbi:hypothetical protein PV08_06614 [Exophiala spinifera]|uniref:Uncharacterized protein n=1 Tax=Exophiala spinifera TaxID=91928 RepID=A0A0D2BRE4_9EURO|nr:uncharacterized protein PV08_06614 [Exophiala spinifera]KIW13834.1 hypothetical protein PV08_06614 [Exophiala spinifera]
MEPDNPSPRYTTFSGVTLDNAQLGTLSSFHDLDDDGAVSGVSDEYDTWVKEVGGSKELESLVEMGLAAVRVRVANAHLQGEARQSMDLSGFRLSKDLIVTCAHFTDWDLPGNNVDFFLNGQNGGFEAVQRHYIRPTNWPEKKGTDSFVEKEDIHFSTREERSMLRAAPSWGCWSVGYNRAVNMNEFRERFKSFFNRRSHEEKAMITQEWNFDDECQPESEFLAPNTRTISFGTKIEHPDMAKEHQECIELSAWYGRSGSMVCTKLDKQDAKPKIIGIIQGGEDSPDRNFILLFNTEMSEWWEAATDLRESSDPNPVVISKRIVMGR